MDSDFLFDGKPMVDTACCWECVDREEVCYWGMLLCPECGNKRCPKASDCSLPCSGSNEPGQKGSIYE